MQKIRGFEFVEHKKVNTEDNEFVRLPLRGSKNSAGYDFYTPVDLVIPPQKTVKFYTDVKAYMQEDEVLLIDVRSSIGVKKGLMIANTIGVIDSDYYNNESNEGNIIICLRNLNPEFEFYGYDEDTGIPKIKDLREENTIVIKAGERVAQGIFVKYLKADNCNSEEERKGGVGSTTI